MLFVLWIGQARERPGRPQRSLLRIARRVISHKRLARPRPRACAMNASEPRAPLNAHPCKSYLHPAPDHA